MAKTRHTTILTITSMKGGVGKTTISAMLAQFAADRFSQPIVVIDLDPQAGISSILLGGAIGGPTIADILKMEGRGVSSNGAFHEAARPCRYNANILVVPSAAALMDVARADGSNTPDLLARMLSAAPVPSDALIIVDTGTAPELVRMGIHAADLVVVPIMFSQQTARPTINTLMMTASSGSCQGALAPVGMGKTQWESKELDRWRKQLMRDEALAAMGFGVLPPLPYSKAIVRGRWRYGRFPARFEPFFEALYTLATPGKKDHPGGKLEAHLELEDPREVSAFARKSRATASSNNRAFVPERIGHGG